LHIWNIEREAVGFSEKLKIYCHRLKKHGYNSSNKTTI
jgi:hypothetical protein